MAKKGGQFAHNEGFFIGAEDAPTVLNTLDVDNICLAMLLLLGHFLEKLDV